MRKKSVLMPSWVQELTSSYEDDHVVKEIIKALEANPESKPGYTLRDGVQRHKGQLSFGAFKGWGEKILQELND